MEKIVIIDFGAQYSHLIARRIRELGVYSEIVPHDIKRRELEEKDPIGIIFSGGPASVYSEGSLGIHKDIYSIGVPILGICYGAQLLAKDLGGKVRKSEVKEYGKTQITLSSQDSVLLRNWPFKVFVWMSHADAIMAPPAGSEVTSESSNSIISSFENNRNKIFGVQFHPEVIHTPNGNLLFRNFVFDVCKAKKNWTSTLIISKIVKEIKEQIGSEKAISALSGGVDSTVASALVSEAIGPNLTCIFVDTGLLRKNEADEVRSAFKAGFGMNLVFVDAKDRFIGKIAGVSDPERKRKLIGNEFIKVFEEQSQKIDGVKFLVQGTLYPDVIESGLNASAVIKTHHNVGGLPARMKLKLSEPLRLLFKDEVRKIGLELGLPDQLIYRQPFPGPGLAVRIIGTVTQKRLDILRRADEIICQEFERNGLSEELWQYFAVLLAVKTVGVMGDSRSYSYPIVIRAVKAQDAMTADWARIPYELLETVSMRITNEVEGVNRVVYDITSKPPGTIEWE